MFDIKIKVIGVGGAGNNSINLLLNEPLENVELFIANTDNQDLLASECQNKIFLGNQTQGLGTGGNPTIGHECALESSTEIQKILEDTNILILSAGLGGGTGTGAAPVIAEIAKNMGILTIAVVTTPFEFEGTQRKAVALSGLENLKNFVNSYIVLSNQKVLESCQDLPIKDVFKVANLALKNTTNVIRDIIFKNGYVNLDFNDLRQILYNGEKTIIGVGHGYGRERVIQAVEEALANLLTEEKINSCEKIALFFQTDSKTSFSEINQAKDLISKKLKLADGTQIFFGMQYANVNPKDEFFQISIIASSIKDNPKEEVKIPMNNNVDFSLQQTTKERPKINFIIPNNEQRNTQTNSDSNQDALPDFF